MVYSKILRMGLLWSNGLWVTFLGHFSAVVPGFDQWSPQCPSRAASGHQVECSSTATFWLGFNDHHKHSYEGRQFWELFSAFWLFAWQFLIHFNWTFTFSPYIIFCFASPHSVSLNRSVNTENQKKGSQNKCYIVTISNKNMSPEIFKNYVLIFIKMYILNYFSVILFLRAVLLDFTLYIWVDLLFPVLSFLPTQMWRCLTKKDSSWLLGDLVLSWWRAMGVNIVSEWIF